MFDRSYITEFMCIHVQISMSVLLIMVDVHKSVLTLLVATTAHVVLDI